MCTRVQLIHEPVYRDIVRHKSTRQITYECCPGWEPTTKNSNSCMKRMLDLYFFFFQLKFLKWQIFSS